MQKIKTQNGKNMSVYEIMDLDSLEEHNQWIRVAPDPKKEESNDGAPPEVHTFDAIDAVNSYFKEFIYPFKVFDDGFKFKFLIRRTEPGKGEGKCVFIFARAIVEKSFQDQTDPILNVFTRGLNEEDS